MTINESILFDALWGADLPDLADRALCGYYTTQVDCDPSYMLDADLAHAAFQGHQGAYLLLKRHRQGEFDPAWRGRR